MWTSTTLMSIFPHNVHTDNELTKIQVLLPAKLPWTTQGNYEI